MAVDLNILKRRGVSAEAWKEIFTAKKVQDKPKAWIERIQKRNQVFEFSH